MRIHAWTDKTMLEEIENQVATGDVLTSLHQIDAGGWAATFSTVKKLVDSEKASKSKVAKPKRRKPSK